METESVRLRARSNSAESWEATNGPASRSSARHTWQTPEEDPFVEKQSSTEDNSKVSRKQDELFVQTAILWFYSSISPVTTCLFVRGTSFLARSVYIKVDHKALIIVPLISLSAPVNGSSPNGSTNNAVVLRRQKNAQISEYIIYSRINEMRIFLTLRAIITTQAAAVMRTLFKQN